MCVCVCLIKTSVKVDTPKTKGLIEVFRFLFRKELLYPL